MVNIINQPNNPNLGGFRHYSGLLPANPGDGNINRASVRIYHVPATNTAAIYRGDIVAFGITGAANNPGGADLPENIAAPGAPGSVVGGGGGSGLGNASMAPNVRRWVPNTAAQIIAGVVVGFGPITLFQAKNGFQFIPALTEAWLFVETDPDLEMTATVPAVPGTAFNLNLNSQIDVKDNAGFQAVRFGISGLSLDTASIGQTAANTPLRILSSGEQIGNDPTSAGFVAKVTWNRALHFKGGAGFAAD